MKNNLTIGKRVSRLELLLSDVIKAINNLTPSKNTSTPTPTVPSLQEVTNVGSTTNKKLEITGGELDGRTGPVYGGPLINLLDVKMFTGRVSIVSDDSGGAVGASIAIRLGISDNLTNGVFIYTQASGENSYSGIGDIILGLPNQDGTLVAIKSYRDYADDTAAAAAGIPIHGIYHTNGVMKIRLI